MRLSSLAFLTLAFAASCKSGNSASDVCGAYIECLQSIVASGGPSAKNYQPTLAAAQDEFGNGSCDASSVSRASCDSVCKGGLESAHTSFPQLASCGPLSTSNGPPGTTGDNVSACNAFVSAASCGGSSLAGTYDCSAYAGYPCDVSAYFSCLSQHYVCTNGSYDPIALAGASSCPAPSCQNVSPLDLGPGPTLTYDLAMWSSPDLLSSTVGCNGFVSCLNDCFTANPTTATLSGCETQCSAHAKPTARTEFENAFACGQQHCLGNIDLGNGKCKLSGGSLVNQDGSQIMDTDPTTDNTGTKDCGVCLNDALANLLGATCVNMSNPDCNPTECKSVTSACLGDTP
jgi:hypothetical protein